ncbi:MAG TPA: alanine racemase [Ardenticatenaceae bacterium]|nr:alanine racemase [Ardenticatenaceae bacterium]
MTPDHCPTWLEVSLDAIRHNVRLLCSLLAPGVELAAVVKANAYGHGALPVARAALRAGASRLAVARPDEGLALREGGIEAPVWVLGYVPPAAARSCVEAGLTVTVAHQDQAEALAGAARALGREPLAVHLKVDTGLSRYGVLPEEVVSLAQSIVALPELSLEGLWTHYAVSEEPGHAYTARQLAAFQQVVAALAETAIRPPILHTANSGAILNGTGHFNCVRAGVTLYGLQPEPGVAFHPDLRPAMSWKARVARVHTLVAGAAVSYGCTFVAERPTRVALVPVGYGDGYPRRLANGRGAVLIGGQRCPVLGRVCMDNVVVNVDHLAAVAEGDEVVLLGSQGRDQITAEELALWQDTNNYEVDTRILPRPPRFYPE